MNVALHPFFAKPFIVVVDTSENNLNVKLYGLRGGEEKSRDSLCDSEMRKECSGTSSCVIML